MVPANYLSQPPGFWPFLPNGCIPERESHPGAQPVRWQDVSGGQVQVRDTRRFEERQGMSHGNATRRSLQSVLPTRLTAP